MYNCMAHNLVTFPFFQQKIVVQNIPDGGYSCSLVPEEMWGRTYRGWIPPAHCCVQWKGWNWNSTLTGFAQVITTNSPQESYKNTWVLFTVRTGNGTELKSTTCIEEEEIQGKNKVGWSISEKESKIIVQHSNSNWLLLLSIIMQHIVIGFPFNSMSERLLPSLILLQCLLTFLRLHLFFHHLPFTCHPDPSKKIILHLILQFCKPLDCLTVNN